MARLIFNAARHEYSVAGVRLPSVTEVLKAQGIVRPWSEDQFYRDRGTAIHEAARILLTGGELEESSIDPAIEPFIGSLRRWIDAARPETLLAEQPLADTLLGYAGTLDALTIEAVLYDFKSGGEERGHSTQLAAYSDLCRVNGYPVERVAVVYLTDGKPRTRFIPAARLSGDLQIFRSALAVHRFRLAEGLA